MMGSASVLSRIPAVVGLPGIDVLVPLCFLLWYLHVQTRDLDVEFSLKRIRHGFERSRYLKACVCVTSFFSTFSNRETLPTKRNTALAPLTSTTTIQSYISKAQKSGRGIEHSHLFSGGRPTATGLAPRTADEYHGCVQSVAFSFCFPCCSLLVSKDESWSALLWLLLPHPFP
jgi:hypothetical protein